MSSVSSIADEIERYLRTGETDSYFAAWPGDGFLVHARGASGASAARSSARSAGGLGQITTSALKAKLEQGVFGKNLARKGRFAITALERGVERVHVIDSRTPHSIIAEFFTDQGIGSLVTNG